MKILSAFRRYVLFAVSMVALLGFATPAFATHLRGGTVSWRVTGTTVSNGTVTAYTVQFTLVESSRWSYPGTAGTCGTVNQQSGTCPALNSTVNLTTLTGGEFYFGDGGAVEPTGTVTSINQAQDYLTATFVFSHTYSSSYQNVKAYFNSGNRISTLKIGHDQEEYIYTIVQDYANGSATAATPAILAVPLQNTVNFNISSLVTDIDPNATLVYRLATLAELYGPGIASVPCPNNYPYTSPAPPGFTVSQTGQVTWLTTAIATAVSGGNCGLGNPAAGDLWPVQIMVEAHDKTSNALLTETPIDLLMQFINPVGALPTITLSPSGTQTVAIGTPVAFTATANSGNANAKVTLNASGIPNGATATGLNAAVTPPGISNFSWTPAAGQNGTFVITYTVTDNNLQQATASNTIVVATLPTITCSTAQTFTYGQTGTLTTSVYDSNNDLLNVVWAVDGTNVQTNSNVTAYPNAASLQLQQAFGNAGSHTVKVTATDPHGVAVSCTTPVTVSQAAASVTPNSATKVYGSSDPAFTGTLSGFLPADNITATYTRVSGETVAGGPYAITATLSPTAAISNYSVTYNAAALTITPASSNTSLTCPVSVTYNGLPQTPCSATVTGVGGLNQAVAVSYSANVNVGLVTASATYAGDTNHAASTNSTTFTILPAAQVITFTPVPTSPDTAGDTVVLSATGGASGQPVVFSVLSGNASLAADGVTLTYTGAGTVVVAADQAAGGNYAAATEATATIVVNPVAGAYSAGTVPVATQSSILTATLNFPNGGTLDSLSYLTQGAANLDFIGCSGKKQQKPAKGSLPTSFSCGLKTEGPVPVCSVGTAYSAGQICTVSYIFQPTAPGQRLGGITALDASGNLMGSSYITGTGTGPVAVLTPGTISTVAGTYYYGTASGDGGAATSAALKGPQDVTVDAAGNFYIADEAAQTIRKVTASTGIITTVAGNGSPSYSGDGGPATNASLQTPLQVAVDGLGNLYIADSINNRIREVTAATGIITTVAGSGPIGYNAGLSYLYGNSIGDGGPATSAILCNPTGIAVDGAGNLYISDFYNKSLRMVTAATGIITTVAGNGFYGYTGNGSPITGPLSAPNGLAIDGSGNVYVADVGKQAIWKVTPSTGTFSIVAGSNSSGNYTGDGGPATSAALDNPLGVALDAAGNIYIADSGNQAVRKVTASTGIITTIVGTGNSGLSGDGGPANTALLNYPDNVAVDGAGNLYIADRANARIREVAASSATHNFADTNVGSTSTDSPAIVIVANNGYDPTSINPLTFSGISTGTTNFVLDATNACSTSTSLEPGQTCALAVDFTPQTSGTPLTDAVTLADNNLNNINSASSPQTVALSGNGLQQTPGVTVAPATITYGTSTVALSGTVSFVGSIAPTGAVTFTIDSGSAVVASCTGTTSPLTCTATYPSGTLGVPTHTITAGIAATPGFLVSSGTNTLTVTPAPLTVTAGSYTGVYDGNIHGLSACVVSSNPDGLTCTNSPAGPVGPDAGQAVVTPVISGSTANYSVTTNNGAWTITALPVSVSAGEYSGVYDGSAHSLTSCASSYGGVTCSNSPASVGPGVGSGTVTPVVAYATGIAADYQITPANGAWSITQATSVTTLTCPASVVYNGTAQTPCTANVTGAGGFSQSVTVIYGANTIVGTASASATFTGDANHSGSTKSTTFAITPAPLTVTAGSYTGIYDGSTHALSACVVSSNPDGLTCSNSPVGPVGPNVGGTTVTPVISGSTSNYTVTSNNGAWSITAKAVTVTAGSYNGTYDGSAHSPSACTSSYTGVTCANSPASVGPGSGSGTVSPVVSYATGIAGDYQITPQNGAWSIAQASSITSITCTASVIYNGTTQTPCTANVTGAGGLSQSVTVIYGANTIVGTASASATFTGDANHTGSTKSTTFAITPASLTVTAGSYTGVYDGASHALSACVVSANPDGLTCTNSPATVGPDFGSGTVTPVISGSTSNYSVTKNNGSWSITAKAVTVTAGSYSGTYDGATHAPSACASSYAGVACTNSPASVGPNVGSGAVNPVASFTTGNAADYTVTTVPGSFAITKLAASVTPNAATKVYGTADPAFTGTLSGFLPADGVTATYSRTAGESVAGSPYAISATLSPTAVLSNYAITYNTAGFTITKATPVLSWTNPAAITYGTALSATQLNATSNLSGGTFQYTPLAGTVVTAGSQTLSVLYTPSDTADYTTATASVPLTVGQATPVVTWANPPSIVYGTGTGAAQKTATATGVGGVSLPGAYFYTTPDGTVFTVGTHPLGVAFTPTDITDYVPVSAYAYLTVTKATPTVTWSAPAAITYGTALSGAQLNATASVPGTFSYSPAAGTVLHAGAQTLSVTFTPNDTTDYSPVTTTVPLTVNKATPVITWPTPASITYGTPLSSTQLNATANVPGTFVYTAETGANPLGVLLVPGTTALSATLTPTDTVDYNSVTAYVVFTVSKAQTSTTLAVTTTQTVTGTTATITATVHPQIGGTPTGTVTYYNGSTTLGSAAVGTPFTTAVLPVGTDQITAVYSGDSNFVGSSSSASAVTSLAPTTVQLSSPLGTVFYPASAVSFTVIVPLKGLQLISGTVTLYDGSTVIGTYSLPAGGILAGVTPQLGVGTHSLRAVYSGNAQYPPGQSPIVTVTVSKL